MAEMADDPDSQYFEILKTGVPLGVKEPPLKSPGIWPTKEELKGESPLDGALEDPRGRGNYASSDDIRDMDMVLGPLTAQEAASLCGCDIPELCPGPMAAIDEGDKIRAIYDGLWGGANAHIQANTEERTTAPTVMDCLHGIHWLQASQKRTGTQEAPLCTLGLAQTGWPVDAPEGGCHEGSQESEDTVTRVAVPGGKTRGRVVDKQSWHIWYGQCATLLGASCLGLASPLISCLSHGGLGVLSLWMTSAGSCANHLPDHSQVPSSFFWWPLAALWVGRTAIGLSNTWLGFIMTPDLQLVRMAPTKHELVIAVLDKMMDNQTFTKQELDSALGRLQWATNCCPLTKPFLQAFWQWKSAVKSSGKPNKLLRGFAHLLHCLFEKDYHHPTPYAPQSSWWGASDASASDSGEAYVGGWISNHPNPEKHQVWWFHYQVREDQHPWAFKDRKPKRRIAALEMLGTLFLTMYLCKKSSLLKGPVLLPLASDNQGNIYGLLNDYTRKMPTAGLLMEIMFQLTATSCSLMPSHVKRDFNQWADDLTHPSFEGFDSSLELRVTPLL